MMDSSSTFQISFVLKILDGVDVVERYIKYLYPHPYPFMSKYIFYLFR